MSEYTYLELAAQRLGIPAHELWDYREGRDGISFRTPDGYRHHYRYEELEVRLLPVNRNDRGRRDSDPGGPYPDLRMIL